MLSNQDRPIRFVLNTRNPDSAAAAVCIHGLSKHLRELGHPAAINDWSNYQQYDVAIFMAADADIASIRASNPNIRVGVADPKPSTLKQAQDADFCIVSSIEQREAFLQYNRNVFIHYMIPEFDSFPVKQESKDLHRIFYHGNKVHLNGAFHGLVPALNELGKRYAIEFNAIYNIKELGLWALGRPDVRYCPTRDLQWYPNCYKDYLSQADIGVVQNLMPFRHEQLVRWLGTVSKTLLLESTADHIVKFKSSANAGRAFVFGYFNIPVVADATPSMGDAIVDGYSGRLALGAEGWFDALEELILSPERRYYLATNFRREIEARFSPRISAERLMGFLHNLSTKPPVELVAVQPSVFMQLSRESFGRAARRVRRIFLS